MEVGGEKRQLVAADNTTSKRRKLNADVLQRLARDLSDEQLEKAVNVLCADVSLARAAKYVKCLTEFWEEPLSKLPEELFQLILYNAFDTPSQALQLALVCKHWYSHFQKLDFWLPWIRRTAGDEVGVRYLFKWAGLEAAVCAKTRKRDNRQEQWCYAKRFAALSIMGHFTASGFEGPAVIVYSDAVYEGEVKHGLRDGQGTLYLHDGDRRTGQWKKGAANGYGAYYWADGDYDRGYWKNSRLHGHAVTYCSSEKALYVGNFQNEKRCGYGKYVSKNETYCGEWSNHKRHGHGVGTFANGDSYEGEYKEGKRHGTGIYYWRDEQGRLIEVDMGSFVDNEFTGGHITVHVILRYVIKGRRKEGEWIGLSRIYFENGDRIDNMYDNSGVMRWSLVVCESGTQVYRYWPSSDVEGNFLLSIDYPDGSRYVARAIDNTAVGSFVDKTCKRACIDPFADDRSGAARLHEHLRFTVSNFCSVD